MIEIVPKEKFILDATAGHRMMWFNKNHPNCLYVDQRPEVEPDIIGDFRNLKDIPNESFRLVVFDPPHVIKSDYFGNHNASMPRAFGVLKADTVEADIKQAFKELWRVLAPYGVLLFKWNTQCVSSDKLIALAPCPPLFYQISSSKQGKNGGGGNLIKTLWFCFMKIPSVNP